MPDGRPHITSRDLGRRVHDARLLAGLTQVELAGTMDIDRSAVARIENGQRKISALELIDVAACLDRSVTWFVSPPLQSVASRRAALAEPEQSILDSAFDRCLEDIGLGVRGLLEDAALTGVRRPTYPAPVTVLGAENLASQVRAEMSLGEGPLADLPALCERLGLLAFCLNVAEPAPDGSMIEVEGQGTTAGVALVNGMLSPGRRRFTLAHELGHWLTGDDYEAVHGGPATGERMLNAFAVHLLLPRAGVLNDWANLVASNSQEDAVLRLSARYRTSWSATLGQLRNLDLLTAAEFDRLSSARPSWLDVEVAGARWIPEIEAPFVPAGYRREVLGAYSRLDLTRGKTLDLLWGAVTDAELPVVDVPFRRNLPSILG